MAKRTRFIKCSQCGETLDRDLIIAGDDGQPVCSQCFIFNENDQDRANRIARAKKVSEQYAQHFIKK